jgi:3-methyladenine DNA glycosylase AlkC
MPASEDPPPAQLKEWFDEARHRSLARELTALSKSFCADTFLRLTLEGLEERSLMQRLHQCAVAADAALAGTFPQKVRVLQKLAPRIGHGFVPVFLCDFVATFGAHDLEFSMEALKFFTPFGSAEFAVRGFIAADPGRALSIMKGWTRDPDEHVRRLASEGSRPRLPWGMKLKELVRDPSPCADILEALKDDTSLYVRRSVANHLNDITKDHEDWVLDRLEGWELDREPLRWIARHACRTLIKRGHPRALQLFGFGGRAQVEAGLQLRPARLRLGEKLQIEAVLRSTSTKPQTLAVDYVIHYVKSRGTAFEKVFKWTEIELPPKGVVELRKNQVIRDFTTRRHHPGHHGVELQVNGRRVARTGFDLLDKPRAS